MFLKKIIKKVINKFYKILEKRNLKKKEKELLNRFESLENKDLLLQNEEFKDKYKGQRCFIIGNGPSTKKQDLSSLKNEYVFTVNSGAKNSFFKDINPSFHVWADRLFFKDETEADLKVVEQMRALTSNDNKPIVFYPIEQSAFVQKHKLNEFSNDRYFWDTLSNLALGYKKIDISKWSYGFPSVTQYAIQIAIYMGFSEIYLLGCDATVIVNVVNSILKKGELQYAFECDAKEREKIEKINTTYSVEQEIYINFLAIKGYGQLYDYCKHFGIRLVNCSAETILDNVPREKYEDVIKNKKKEQ